MGKGGLKKKCCTLVKTLTFWDSPLPAISALFIINTLLSSLQVLGDKFLSFGEVGKG